MDRDRDGQRWRWIEIEIDRDRQRWIDIYRQIDRQIDSRLLEQITSPPVRSNLLYPPVKILQKEKQPQVPQQSVIQPPLRPHFQLDTSKSTHFYMVYLSRTIQYTIFRSVHRQTNMYTYIYIYTYGCTYTNKYVFIYRCADTAYTQMYICSIYIYIYIYTYT